MIRAFFAALLGVAFALGITGSAGAQTLSMMKGIDAPHYDAQRTSWGPTSDIVNMIQDTLVALDYERTPGNQMTLEGAREFLNLINEKLGRKAVLYSGDVAKSALGTK